MRTQAFDAKSSLPCWRKVYTNAPGGGSTATDKVGVLRAEGGRRPKQTGGGGRQECSKGEHLAQKGRLACKS